MGTENSVDRVGGQIQHGEQQQVVTIHIACVVPSDEVGLAIKRTIADALSGIEKKRVTFTFTDGSIPPILHPKE